ncbi:MAG: hypothetical protein Q4E47_02635 [Candidatus Saccharibacteria bacterium]|nr:hypothetical protein [Candidatus Saccharibacteria bacterium]
MKTLIIGSKNFGTKNDPTFIANNTNSDICFFEDLIFDIKTNSVQVLNKTENILEKGYDTIICLGWYKTGKLSFYRDVAYSLALTFDHAGIKYWNSEMGTQRSTSKLSQMVLLALNGHKIADTIFSLDGSKLTDYITDGKKHIVKTAMGSCGKNNFLLDSKNEIIGLLTSGKRPFNHFLVQEFIENDHDLRVICFGGKPHLVLKRSRKDNSTHLNNTSQGGTGEWVEITPELKAEATAISKLFGREMGGVDFIETIDKNGYVCYYCLEINAIPQLTSGSDVNRKMSELKSVLNEN